MKNSNTQLFLVIAFLMAVFSIGSPIVLELDPIVITFTNAGTFLLFGWLYLNMRKKKK